MPNTFYYLRGALNEQALTAQHGDRITKAITRLLTGDYTAKNLEKLNGHSVYSFRINDAARFLFTTHRVGNADYLLVLDYLPSHDYHKSRFLRSGVLRNYLAREEQGELEFTSVSSEEMAALPVCASEEDVNGITLDYFHQQFIELNNSQHAALQVPLPAVISGVAGSGKSCIALSLLSSYVSDNPSSTPRRIAYVTQSEALVASMCNAWQQLPVAVDAIDTVEFISYAQLVRQQLDVSAPPLVDKAAFEAWYGGDSAQSVYEELRICSGYDETAYLALGQRQSLVDSHERAAMYACYQRYMEYQSTQGYDPGFYPLRGEPMYDLVVVDEAQDLSHGANQNLRHLARGSSIVYCLDSLQQLHDRRSIRPYLLETLRVNERHHVQLTTTHRCPRRVAAVANEVVALKHRLVGGISDKYEPTEIKVDNTIDGEVHLFSERELVASDWFKATKGTQFAVITEAVHRDQARQLFETELVMTPEEIKGLEYPTVVTYRLYPVEDFKKIHKRINSVGERRPTHRPKAGESHEEFAPLMNRIYSSYMRAQQTLVICEQPSYINQCLLNPIKQLTQAAPFKSECVSQQATPADWSREVMRQLTEGNHDIANRLFLKHKLGTEAEFNALLPESKIKPVVVQKTRHNTKEETREKRAVKQLFEHFEPLSLEASFKTHKLKSLLLNCYQEQTLLQFIQQDLQRTQIFFTILVNDLELLKKLINIELSNDCEPGEFKDNLKFLESLLGALDLANQPAGEGLTPLCLAITKNMNLAIQNLIRIGADVKNAIDTLGEKAIRAVGKLDLITDDTLNHVITSGQIAGQSVAFFLSAMHEGRAILAANQYRLANLVSQDTLNHIITAGPKAGLSVTFWLVATPQGLALLAANQYRLANLVSQKTLNHIIPAGPKAGLSAAFCLAAISEGRALLAANQYRLANLLSQKTLNHIIAVGSNAGLSVAFWLALTPQGLALLAANQSRLANLVSQDTLNHVIVAGSHAGLSVFFCLAGTSEGRAILAANEYRLANLVSQNTLNHIIAAGPHAGESVAFWLAATPEGRAMLAANQYRLANLVSQKTLNQVIVAGSNAGLSVFFCLAARHEGRAILAANQSRLANLVRQGTVNHVIVAGANAGLSVFFCLARTPEGRTLLASNQQRLANLVSQDTLNHIITGGPKAGESVAFWLSTTPEGLALLAANQYRLANLLSEDTLNHIIVAGANAGVSVAFWLAATPEGRAILAANKHRLANLVSQDTLNHVIVTGARAGLSVYFCLAGTSEGRPLLAANQYRLANLVSQDTLNHVIVSGPNAGVSVAFWLAATPEGRTLMEANKHRLANLLSEDTLNHVIVAGPKAGESVAFWLAVTHEGRALLAANQYRLANLVNQNALNHIIADGPKAGESVAFWLTGIPEGRALLAANQYRLANLVNQNALNHIIAIGSDAGESAAFWLAATPEGRALLAANEYRLANLISQNTLNHIIAAGPKAGESVAFWLSATPEGRAQLAAKKYRLASLLSQNTLNHIIAAGPKAGMSVAFWLVGTAEGPDLLAANEYQLTNLLSQDTLNQVIAAGPKAGESVAFWLAATHEGRALLAAKKYRLANLLSQNTLNHVIATGPSAGESVAFWLAEAPEGQALLAANQYRLANLLSQDTLNDVIAGGPYAGKSVASLLLRTDFGQRLLSMVETRLIDTEYISARMF